jgi:hypothetical protein
MHGHVASIHLAVDGPKADMSEPLLLRCTALTCYTPHGPWGQRDEAA